MPRAQAQAPAPRPELGSTIKTAPLVKSMVCLDREKCVLERDPQGCYIKFVSSALAAGEATAFFLASVVSDGSSFAEPEAARKSSQRFEAGKGQQCRLFLSSDIQKSLEGFKEDNEEKHQLVLDLKVDSGDSHSITAQRSFITFKEGETPEITKQMVQCGSVVKLVEALYGTMPNPRPGASGEGGGGSETVGDGEGGDCVICLSKPRDVVILHCRHVCLCMSCAKITSSTWSFQCPVCRGRVAAMVGLDEAVGTNS